MKLINIPKKSGGTRLICIQGPHEKHNYRYLGYRLAEFHEKNTPDSNICHGFVEGKSPISNAQQHINKNFTLTVDLKDFFDSVTPEHLIRAGVDTDLANKVCYLGTTKQGLSSSPAAANCAAIPLDRKILGVIPSGVTYTRYADDLSFSCDNLQVLVSLRDILPRLVEDVGFKINPKKTRIQSSKFGRRIITGVAVDDNIHPTRKQRKILRAARHNLSRLIKLLSFLLWTDQLLMFALLLEVNRKMISQFVGLKEWCKLKQPTKSFGGKLFTTAVIVRTKMVMG